MHWLTTRWMLVLEALGVVAFVALLAVAVTTPPPVSGPAETVAWEDMAGDETHWSGIYMGDDKIGYSSSRVVPRNEGWRTVERTFLRLGSMGEQREIHTHATADLDAGQRAVAFDFEMQTGDTVFRASGDRNTVRYSIGGGREEVIELPDTPLLAASHPRLLAAADEGSTLELPYLDPATMTRDEITYHVGRMVPVPGLEGVSGRHVRYQLQGADVAVWLDGEGRTLREEGLLGMVVLREPREVALTRGWSVGGPPDVVALSAVPVDRPIDGARESRVLVLRLTGPDTLPDMLAAAHGERWDGTNVGIRVPEFDELTSYHLPMVDEAFEPYLASEPLIEVDDPTIQDAVNAVVDEITDAESAAKRLVDWVYHELEKTPVVAVPSAVQVLETRRGDCNEHTALYTALARAAGIPTRVSAGIVYTEALFSKGSFYYHAWPEVWLGQWVAVDPTFGQFPADATHVKLVEGGLDRQVELVGVIGSLSAEVVEVR